MPEVVPRTVLASWANGPMGPGFFLLLPRNKIVTFDGEGPMDFGAPARDRRRLKDTEILALLLLIDEDERC